MTTNTEPNDCGDNLCPHCACDPCKCHDTPDDSMDGDAASALASAGFGTDEDYEHNLID